MFSFFRRKPDTHDHGDGFTGHAVRVNPPRDERMRERLEARRRRVISAIGQRGEPKSSIKVLKVELTALNLQLNEQ